ncbi:hypothetical protein [Gaetbulibacter sp. NE]|uniref:hypothetical protein n=1 Tax=Gaetbulibacter sp. NE TaxID=2982307 RepID=UPI0021D091C3|nr:hypothetical protein [Gaetbulibacter sp. NE]
MRLTESQLKSKILKTYNLKNGIAHFFENFVVIETSEGVFSDFENSKDLISLIDLHFGTQKPFGIISNRVNSYSINILDSEKFKQRFPNAIAKAVVAYSNRTTDISKLESYFCHIKRKDFTCLLESEKWMRKELNNSNVTYLR